MKFVLAIIFAATFVSAQQPQRSIEAAEGRRSTSQAQPADMNAVWSQELPNLKSDLSELRSMLNVMGSQEMSLDTRTSGVFQTNRQMWQVVIARLAELTQRLDALERSQDLPNSKPRPERP